MDENRNVENVMPPESTCESPDKNLTLKVKNSAAVELGRMGGKIGGKVRAAKLSAEQRSTIARTAANARWSKNNNG